MTYDFGPKRFKRRTGHTSEKWPTANEIDFLKRLGTHRVGQPSDISDVSTLERLKLLQGYKRLMEVERLGSDK